LGRCFFHAKSLSELMTKYSGVLFGRTSISYSHMAWFCCYMIILVLPGAIQATVLLLYEHLSIVWSYVMADIFHIVDGPRRCSSWGKTLAAAPNLCLCCERKTAGEAPGGGWSWGLVYFGSIFFPYRVGDGRGYDEFRISPNPPTSQHFPTLPRISPFPLFTSIFWDERGWERIENNW
jgi:hypothetical protein